MTVHVSQTCILDLPYFTILMYYFFFFIIGLVKNNYEQERYVFKDLNEVLCYSLKFNCEISLIQCDDYFQYIRNCSCLH